MLRTICFFLCFSFSGNFSSFSQQRTDSTLKLCCSENKFTSYLPVCKGSVEIVNHVAYSLGYSEPHEQAAWVCYVLSKGECNGDEERSSSFYPDKAVRSGSACNSDYKASGYDRGHLAPAGDMSFSETAMKESFYYSNMSPQVPAFNRGIWKRLESQVRNWGVAYGELLVITGPVLTDSLQAIGPNKVSVPQSYYKIVVNPNASPPQAIGFLMKNASSNSQLDRFTVTVDSIETVTGIDFFSALPPDVQSVIESQVNGSYWQGFESINIVPARTALPPKKKTSKTVSATHH